MNNGLNGRYPPALEAWNNSRSEAARLANEYRTGKLADTPTPAVKQALSRTVFYSAGQRRVDTVARRLLEEQ
jgi:hypothetical protein